MTHAAPTTDYASPAADRTGPYRVGRRNPHNLYLVTPGEDYTRDEHVGVMFHPDDGPMVVAALNATSVDAPAGYAATLTLMLDRVREIDVAVIAELVHVISRIQPDDTPEAIKDGIRARIASLRGARHSTVDSAR